MSSISGADGGNSNRKDEIIRRNREEYQQKESDLVKKHNKEIRRLSQQHYEEVQNLREGHDAQLTDIKKRQQVSQARRDQAYQKKVEDLRGLHRNQLKELAENKQFQIDKVRKAREIEVAQIEQAHQRRLAQINKQHEQDAESREAMFSKDLDIQRESQQKAIQEMRVRLESSHKKEQDAVKGMLDERYDNLRSSHEAYREEVTKNMKDQKVQNLADRQRSSENLIATVRRERRAQEQSRELMKEGFDISLEKQKDRFLREQQKQKMAQQAGVQDLKEDMQTKIRDRTHRLEQKIQDLESDLITQENTLKKQTKNQLDVARQQYSRSLASVEEARNGSLEDVKSRQAMKIKEIHEEKDKVFASQTRRLLSEKATENFRNRQAFETIENQFESRVDQINSNADSRVKTILDQEQEKTVRLEKLYEEARESLRDQQYRDIGELRNKYVAERQTAVENLKSQMRERETKHAEQVDLLNRKYQKEIQAMKDDTFRNKRLSEQNHKDTVENLVRAQDQALASQEMRHKTQVEELQQVHRKEIAKINQRHEDQLNQVLRTARMS